jgi:hypothetical protein
VSRNGHEKRLRSLEETLRPYAGSAADEDRCPECMRLGRYTDSPHDTYELDFVGDDDDWPEGDVYCPRCGASVCTAISFDDDE